MIRFWLENFVKKWVRYSSVFSHFCFIFWSDFPHINLINFFKKNICFFSSEISYHFLVKNLSESFQFLVIFWSYFSHNFLTENLILIWTVSCQNWNSEHFLFRSDENFYKGISDTWSSNSAWEISRSIVPRMKIEITGVWYLDI